MLSFLLQNLQVFRLCLESYLCMSSITVWLVIRSTTSTKRSINITIFNNQIRAILGTFNLNFCHDSSSPDEVYKEMPPNLLPTRKPDLTLSILDAISRGRKSKN